MLHPTHPTHPSAPRTLVAYRVTCPGTDTVRMYASRVPVLKTMAGGGAPRYESYERFCCWTPLNCDLYVHEFQWDTG